MNNKWIEVGENIIQKDLIVAVNKPCYEKYKEEWAFTIQIKYGNIINVWHKNEEFLCSMNAALKKELQGYI